MDLEFPRTWVKMMWKSRTEELPGEIFDLQAICSSGRTRMPPTSGIVQSSHHPCLTSSACTTTPLFLLAQFLTNSCSSSVTCKWASKLSSWLTRLIDSFSWLEGVYEPRGQMKTTFTEILWDSPASNAASPHLHPLLLQPTMSTNWSLAPVTRSKVEQIPCEIVRFPDQYTMYSLLTTNYQSCRLHGFITAIWYYTREFDGRKLCCSQVCRFDRRGYI